MERIKIIVHLTMSHYTIDETNIFFYVFIIKKNSISYIKEICYWHVFKKKTFYYRYFKSKQLFILKKNCITGIKVATTREVISFMLIK